MYKRLIFLISVLVLFFACASYTSAGIIYVDATDGDLGNTALAAGGVFTSVDVGTTGSGADNLWRWRAFANGGTIFESGGDWAGDGNTEDCPRLVTMVAVPEDDYNVYVYFWCDDTGAQWRIQAALADAAGDLPMYLANDPNGPATVADAGDFEDPVPMLTEGNRTLWQVNLGTTGTTSLITVYVDDEPNHLTGNNRTWYDGIGYESAAEPEPEVPCPVDPGTTCLIADYPLESDLNDVSGNGLNGTFMGDPNAGGPNFVAGHDGMALDLDGIDDYVDCGSDALFDMAGNEMTVAAWVTIRACTNAWQVIAAKGEYAWRLSDYNLEPRFHFGITWWQSADTFGVDGVTAVGYDEWHHVAGTFDGANINVYLDGALDNSEPTTEPIGLNAQPMLIGNNPYDLNRWWDGLIDEVKVYDCALSEYEIMYLAGIQPTPIDPGTAGLIAYYPMENDVSDATGNGHDGVFMGDPNAGDPNFAEGLVCNGMALDLDGTGDYVDCGYDPAFDVTTNEITVSAWVTIRSIANQWAAIAAKGEYAWRLGNASWDPRFHFGITIWNAPDTASLDGVTAVGYDEWHHVAGMFDGANIKVYLDGVLDVSTPTTEPIGINDKNMFIGDNPDATGRYWDGLIDELKIYDRALSECELLYLAECPGPEPECENPVTIENASFELPGDGKIKGWDMEDGAYYANDPNLAAAEVPGWNSDGTVADSGVESDWPGSTDGVWTAFLMAGDPSIYQTTDHVLAAGDLFTLTLDARDNWSATPPALLEVSLYADAFGQRAVLVTETLEMLPSDSEQPWATYTLGFAADAMAMLQGFPIGIELRNAQDASSWIGIDNVRLCLGVLPPEPVCEPVHSYTFEDGTTADSVGEAHGTLVGGAAIVDGAMVTTAQDQWMEMPGDVIDINSFDAVTIEAWCTPTAGANTSWSMLAYLGGSSEPNIAGVGINGYFMTIARNDDKSRAAISTGSDQPWADETGADGVEYDDGMLHHVVSTLDGDEITLYIDGVLQARTPMDAHNSIHDLDNDYVLLAKGGYGGDPEWIGQIHEFNIYDCALTEAQVADKYAAGLDE